MAMLSSRSCFSGELSTTGSTASWTLSLPVWKHRPQELQSCEHSPFASFDSQPDDMIREVGFKSSDGGGQGQHPHQAQFMNSPVLSYPEMLTESPTSESGRVSINKFQTRREVFDQEFSSSGEGENAAQAITSPVAGSQNMNGCSGFSADASFPIVPFAPYPKPSLKYAPTPVESYCHSLKPPRVRKRKIVLKPNCPKYEGLSKFAAPVDLLSEVIPNSSFHQGGEQPTNPQPSHLSYSCYFPTQKVDDKAFTTEFSDTIDQNCGSLPEVPIDFLKYLDDEAWEQRKRSLEEMVQIRKMLFLEQGFSETNGKPFEESEQFIEKKPIPNRWVWCMRLSTDYDKREHTRVPSGGPAGYLKYGWDRLGAEGKQPYQELADVYSAQRVKFMSDHGIEEDLTRKTKSKRNSQSKSKDTSNSPKDSFIDQEPWTSGEREASEESQQDSRTLPLQVPGVAQKFVLDSPQSTLGSKYTPAEIPFVPSYLESPQFFSDFFASLAQQDLLATPPLPTDEEQQKIRDSPHLLLSSPLSNENTEGDPNAGFSSLTSGFSGWPAFSPSLCFLPPL